MIKDKDEWRLNNTLVFHWARVLRDCVMNDDEQQKSPKPENGDHGKRKSSLSCLLMFVFCEIKISPEKKEKILSLHRLQSLHGLQSAESAFWGDRA